MEGNEDCCFFGIDCEKLSLVKVRDCLKTTNNHLRYLKASCKGFDLLESHLILNRAGFPLFTQAFLNKQICPRHRDDHGIYWRRSRRTCSHPLHGDSKAKPDRGVTAVMSCEIWMRFRQNVAIGEGKHDLYIVCTKCFLQRCLITKVPLCCHCAETYQIRQQFLYYYLIVLMGTQQG